MPKMKPVEVIERHRRDVVTVSLTPERIFQLLQEAGHVSNWVNLEKAELYNSEPLFQDDEQVLHWEEVLGACGSLRLTYSMDVRTTAEPL